MDPWEALRAEFGSSGQVPASDDWESLKRGVSSSLRPEKQIEKPQKVDDFSGTLRFGSIDTGIELPQWANKRLAQLGAGLADWSLAAQQRFGSATKAQADEKRALDEKLTDDFTGKALKFGGQIAPIFAAPIAGHPVLAGMGAGAIGGAMTPTGEGESAAINTALGAGLGGLIPGVAAGVRRVLRPDAGTIEAATFAQKHGIPFGPADMSKNKVVQAAKSLTNEIPIIGTRGQMLQSAQQSSLNEAVGSTFGANAKQLTPEVVDSAVKRMGSEFDRLWGSNNLVVDAPLFRSLQQLKEIGRAHV